MISQKAINKVIAFPSRGRAKIGVFAIVNCINKKVFIGSGDLQRRKTTNWSLLRAGKHHNQKLQKEWNEFKEEHFKFVTLFEASSSDDMEFLNDCEAYWISLTNAAELQHGYNTYKKTPTKRDFILRIEPM
ncbi:hypothetical protein BK133_12515 [Paenibacillus sp. FSL H8-0548]|uniref:hypothetical protein n=1 Tax=Paenibacillus sp. FSL H8-0548 TaxID=1920422 RepID=UPI00096E8160|nr:hypothetical protein [Paenibacillus sp. FSL H8-0548]OMF34610.1 hypothetical protein BK133_12515 [Paenibacillus sp. FSL H8-0548]